MKRLRTTKQLTLSCPPIDEIPKPKLRIMFQNVQSLRKHFEEVKSNKDFQSADVLLFCETWLGEASSSNDNFEIEGFKKPLLINGWNNHRGLITYSKRKTNIGTKTVNEEFELVNIYFESKSFPYSIILFYKPPSSQNISTFLSTIETITKDPRQQHRTSIIMGDANLDLANATDTLRVQYINGMHNLNLKKLTNSTTTMYNSILDHTWISNNGTNNDHHVRTTYFSDHMPLLIYLN